MSRNPVVRRAALPASALLDAYTARGYTDCYAAEIERPVTLEQYVAAFYTTALFKTERLILRFAVARPSTDEQARALAAGTLDEFAAWRVETRAANQLLLCDIFGRTRSWLMVEPLDAGGTRLYFGSAVVPKGVSASGKPDFGRSFGLLLGFHKLYSVLLLRSARLRLKALYRAGHAHHGA